MKACVGSSFDSQVFFFVWVIFGRTSQWKTSPWAVRDYTFFRYFVDKMINGLTDNENNH